MKRAKTGRNAMEWSIGEVTWIMTTDNSGGIGEKEGDEINVPYQVVSYYAFRTAVMDCLSAGAIPKTVILHNFCGNEAWDGLAEGVNQGLHELGLKEVNVTGSTESTIPLSQSAIAVSILGEKQRHFAIQSHDTVEWSLIGEPLVGKEVITNDHLIAPLSKATDLFYDKDTMIIWPVGSKGIGEEWSAMCKTYKLPLIPPPFSGDLVKSGGPSTCWIIGQKKQLY